jgi:ABC-type lipoprotein release transport system permease subunit
MKIRIVDDSKEKTQIPFITLWSWIISWHQEKKMHTYLVKTLNNRKNVCVSVTMLIITVIKLAISSSIGLSIINEKLCKTTCKIMSIDCMMRVLVVTKSTNVCIPNKEVYET